MPARRGKLDPEKIRASMNATCPHCAASIPPDQQMRIDFERMKCPKCATLFDPRGDETSNQTRVS
jgi:predicted Zn finger-like uncharacterized protein